MAKWYLVHFVETNCCLNENSNFHFYPNLSKYTSYGSGFVCIRHYSEMVGMMNDCGIPELCQVLCLNLSIIEKWIYISCIRYYAILSGFQ